MKIKKLSVFAHELQVVNGPYVFAGGTLGALTTYLVKIEADNGLVGWGETCPLGPTYQPAHALGAEAALRELAPKVVGLEALPRVVGRVMDLSLDGHLYAKAAVDIALYDLLGKSTDLPVHGLLGGALRDSIPSYYAISLMSPKKTAKTVKAKQKEGYTALQIKIGCGDIRRDAAVLRAAWEVLGEGVTLTADANRSMTTSDVLLLSRMISDIPVALEQPCRTMAETNALVGRLHHPLYLDETTENVGVVLGALGQGQCDGLGMKLTRVGGLSPMIAVRDMAAARRVMMSVDDCWGGDVIAAACVHMGATVAPELFRSTWLAAPYIERHYDPDGGIDIRNGWIDVPQGPGLGVNPDEAMFGDPILEV